MPSRSSRLARARVAAALWCVAAAGAPALAEGHAAAARFSDAEIRAAAQRVAADRNLGHQYRSRALRWNQGPRSEARRVDDNNWLARFVHWVRELSSAVAGGARWLLIVAGSIAAAFLAAYLWRLWGRRRTGRRGATIADVPTHIRGLDIRPEQLPDDVGAAALAVWTGGEPRAALLLLYRAALSRLVHTWSVPIRDSSTEGECLRLAGSRLGESARAYLGALVGTWSRASYAALSPGATEFAALCHGFAAGLEAPAAPPDAAAGP